MKFTKMQGAGNDFVIINNFEERLPLSSLPQLARDLCARRLSLGADGLMVVDSATGEGDYRMHFFNSDGSLGEMCGNGARCICRYGFENGLAGETQRVETTAGLVTGKRISERLYRVRLNDPSVLHPGQQVEALGTLYRCDYVELGNPGLPHAVVELPDWDTLEEDELRRIGRALRCAPTFPKGANVTFWRQVGAEHIKVRTFERGVEDFTLACGTGCGSAVAAMTVAGKSAGREVQVDCPGGTLTISLRCQEGVVRDIFLTGPTRIVARGEIVE